MPIKRSRGRSQSRGTSSRRSSRSSSKRSSSARSLSSNGSASTGIGQYNSTGGIVTFKNKRLSKGSKRSFKRLQKKNIATQAPQTFIRTTYLNLAAITAGNQAMYALAPMMSLSGTTNDFDDLLAIATTTVVNATGETQPTDVIQCNKFFVGARQEVEYTNTGSNLVYLDVYDYVCKKDTLLAAPTNILSATPSNYWNDNSATQATIATLGITPFDLRYVTDNITITKVTKFQVEAGNTVMWVRHQKPRYFDGKKYLDLVTAGTQFGLKGWTRGQIIVVCGKVDGSNQTEAVTHAYQTTIRYNVKLLPIVTRVPTMSILP